MRRRSHSRARPRLLPAPALAAALPGAGGALIDVEHLDACLVAVELQRLAGALVIPDGPDSREELDRAAASIVSDLAEGAGRFAHGDRARHFTRARESAGECAALIERLVRRGLVSAQSAGPLRALSARMVRLLTRLGTRLGRRPTGPAELRLAGERALSPPRRRGH